MNIIVECSCQVAYEFEIEPQDGQMPGPVSCPNCGADGTEYANAVIQQQLEQERLAPDTALEPPAEPEPGLESAPSDTTTEATDDGPGLPQFCHQHPDQPLAGFCFHCKKPICQACMDKFDFFCSAACRRRAQSSEPEVPAPARRRVARRHSSRLPSLPAVITLVLLALFVTYGWYRIWGQKPSVKLMVPLARSNPLERAQFTSDHELLLIRADSVAAFDLQSKHETWTKSLAAYRSAKPPPPVPAAPVPTADDAESAEAPADPAELAATYAGFYDNDTRARVRREGDLVVVTMGRDIVAFDCATGAEKLRSQVAGQIRDAVVTDTALVVVSTQATTNHIFTRIARPAGTQQTVRRSVKPPPPRAESTDPEAMSDEPVVREEHHQFLAAGATVACLDVKLLEKKLVAVQTMKEPQPDKFDGELKVTQSIEYAEDVMNEARRLRFGSTTTMDQSRYAVTVQHVFGDTAAPWTGEVAGPPRLFALKTVDVLVAGKTVYAFNRSTQKLWEATLSYGIDPRFDEPELWSADDARGGADAPCVEHGDTVYFFDQGVLTAFATQSGTPRWRIPSVGISRLQFDDRGLLYLNTTSADPESIRYSGEVSLTKPVEPVIAKIDPATGQTLWRVPKLGEDCYLAGKFVYFTRSRSGSLLSTFKPGGKSSSSFRLYRINPRNGKKVWEFQKDGRPSQVDFHDNQILLQFPNRLEVLRFPAL